MIALILMYVLGLGGSTIDVIKDDVKTYVVDSERANEIVIVLSEMEDVMANYYKQIDEIHEEVQQLNAEYDSSEDEYTAVAEKGHEIVLDVRSRVLDQRFKMKELMTHEEWAAVFPPPELR